MTTDRPPIRLAGTQASERKPPPLFPPEDGGVPANVVTKEELREFREVWKRASRMIELALDRLCAG